MDRIYGVNLGGLFVLEPFISPELFQRYPGAVDEFTLSQAMAADQAKGGLSQLEQHYATFIVRYYFLSMDFLMFYHALRRPRTTSRK